MGAPAAPAEAGPAAGTTRRVLLFADCFNNYSHPAVGMAAVTVLERAGVTVRLAPAPACCGRPAISEGLLDQARAMARRNVDALLPYVQAGWQIIGLEPSCTSVFKHELRELLGFSDEGARLVAEAAWDVMAYLGHLLDAGVLNPVGRGGEMHLPGGAAREGTAGSAAGPGRLTLHAHCHQKSLGAHHDAARVLQALTGLPVDVVDAGCCGMAGSFGYKREHYDFSAQIAERVRRGVQESGGLLLTTGTSCTAQLADLYGWQALHPLEILAGLGDGLGEAR